MTVKPIACLLAAGALFLPTTATAAPAPAIAEAAAKKPCTSGSAAKRAACRKARRRTAASGGIHRGTYTCYQGGLTSSGSLFWGTFKVTAGNRYAISGSKGTFRRSGSRLVWLSGSLKKWKWEGRYRTSRTAAGVRQYHVDIIDRPNEIKIQCSD